MNLIVVISLSVFKGVQETFFLLWWIMAIISILVGILSVWIAFFLSDAVAEGISAVKRATELASRGDLNVKVELKTKDELGSLAESFNLMIESLARSNQVAQRDARLLAEKTESLAQSNTVLARNDKIMRSLVEDMHVIKKRLEARTEELRRSNSDLEQFAFAASHDLQEPLRMVLGYCNLLKSRYGPNLDKDANIFIDFAVDGAARMQVLIQGLLEYSRVGKVRALGQVDSGAVFDRALANLQVSIANCGAEVTRDDLPVVRADQLEMERLFQNLIGNGIKYRGRETPKIHVGAERQENEWRFYVRDNGIGIAPQFYEKIFVIFQRLHGRDEYAGSGIGLAICKKTVEHLGGRIWVKSEEGKGSTFYFTIPIRADSTLKQEGSTSEPVTSFKK